MPVRIGELLLKEKRISAEQLQQALSHQKANGGKLGYNLVKMGFAKDEEIASPRPEPPKRRVIEVCPCSKALKIFPILSCSMPISIHP